MIGATLQSRS